MRIETGASRPLPMLSPNLKHILQVIGPLCGNAIRNESYFVIACWYNPTTVRSDHLIRQITLGNYGEREYVGCCVCFARTTPPQTSDHGILANSFYDRNRRDQSQAGYC